MNRIEMFLREGNEKGASDIHLAPGSPVMFRIDGELVPASDEKIKPFEIEEMIEPLLTEEQKAELKENGELDFAYSIAGFHRVRFNVFRQRGTYAVALRILSFEIPEAKKLGIPPSVVDLTNRKRGLVLVTGPTGSGKSTTLASLIHIISETYAKTIITLEDPIEYLHPHSKSIVLQREIGYDSKSYASALRAALREDPDVILVGEMRDLETISIAITAAEYFQPCIPTVQQQPLTVSLTCFRRISSSRPGYSCQVLLKELLPSSFFQRKAVDVWQLTRSCLPLRQSVT